MSENPEIENEPQFETETQEFGETQRSSQAEVNATPSFSKAGSTPAGDSVNNIKMLMSVQLQVTVELGKTNLTISDVVDLQKGSVIELDRVAGEAVDIFVNGSLIARGDVVVVDDKYGVRITELIPVEERA